MKLHSYLFFLLLPFAAAAETEHTTTLDLPDIGDSTGGIMSPEFEKRLGQTFLNHVRKQAPIIDDPEVETYINSVGYRLVSNSDNNTQAFTFFVIQDPMINAFAAPGGIVGMNSGTIINAQNESELAGVVAHEVAHVTQKHMARSVEMQQQLSIPMMAAMLGAILIATQNADAGQAAMMAVQGGMTQAQINFTRGNEEEADRVGMQLLERSGFDPRGMPGFFEKLQKNSRYFAQAPEFLRSHPLTTNRIADTRGRADTYPVKDSYEESRTFDFIKAKLIVKSFRNEQEAVRYYQNELQKAENVDPDGILSYGLGQALMEAHDFDAAAAQFNALLKREPENITFLLAAAEVEMRRERYNEALALYARGQQLYPDHRPLVLNYSRALLVSKRPVEALDVLKKYGKNHEPDLTYLDYLSRAEHEAGNAVESGMANADFYYLSGETRVAIERLRYVLMQQSPRPDYYQQERIHARLAFYEQELEIERDLKLAE